MEIMEEMEANMNSSTTSAEYDLVPDGAAQRECDLFNSAEGAKREDGFYCPKCKNKRLIGYLEYYNGMWYQMTRPCECQQTLKNIAAVKASGLNGDIPKLDTFKDSEDWQKPLKNKARSFVEQTHDSRCFFIGGQSGAGKTHLCSGISWELMHRGKSLRYLCWADEIAELTSYSNQERFARIRDLTKVDILYIDDLLKPSDSKYTHNEIHLAFELVDIVYRDPAKKLIVSSELSIRDLARIDEATAGRIAEMAGPYILTIDKDIKKNYRFRNIM